MHVLLVRHSDKQESVLANLKEQSDKYSDESLKASQELVFTNSLKWQRQFVQPTVLDIFNS